MNIYRNLCRENVKTRNVFGEKKSFLVDPYQKQFGYQFSWYWNVSAERTNIKMQEVFFFFFFCFSKIPQYS